MSAYFKILFAVLISLFMCDFSKAGNIEDGDAAVLKNDYVLALKKYKLAALENDAIAQYRIGQMYSQGVGLAQNFSEAKKWYKLAAEQGHPSAQYNLALRYTKRGDQNFKLAYMWSTLSASAGDIEARELRNLVASLMTAPKITEAKKSAQECKIRNFKNCD